MIHRMARFKVRNDSLDEALGIVRAFVDEVVRKEGGTAKYESYQHADDPTRFTHFMVFRTPSAAEYHRGTPWVKKFVDGLYPLCDEEPTFIDLQPVENKR